MIIINDTHLGVKRRGGVTPASSEALRNWMFRKFNDLLLPGEDILIAGDLFDSFTIDERDLLDAYTLIDMWAKLNPNNMLYLMAGNHDVSMRGDKVSSFQLLTEILKHHSNVVSIPIDTYLCEGNVWMVAHCSNQDVFDMKLQAVYNAAESGDWVILHANYANNFAVESDHSLNVIEEDAALFCDKGVNLIFAHEHQKRSANPHGSRAGGGVVYVLGNQIPSSIADCLGNDAKFYHRLAFQDLQAVPCWDRNDDTGFNRVDWQDLGDYMNHMGFIRIEGEATSAEASDVISAIAKFRNKCPAFVISNAVKVQGMADVEKLPESFEAAKKFDVMAFIKQHLDEEEFKVVEGLV